MDKQDSIKCLKSMQQWIPDWDDREDGLSYWDAIDMAIAALDTPNKPLTCEQLREMDGEPAYIPETNCWVLVTKNPFVPLFTWPDGEQCSAYDWYEQVGPVYRCPPEGEDGDADRG